MSIYLGTTKVSGAYTIAKNLGEVFYSQSSSAADNPGGLPLFTGETISNADQLYPQFYNWLLNHSGLCTTNSTYETSITNWGKCDYYVVDDTNKTIKLPKISRQDSYIIYSYSNGNSWYRIYSDGWCEQGDVSYVSSSWSTISLIKPFLNTTYNIVSGGYNLEGNDNYVYGNTVTRNHTTTTFEAWTSDDESFNAGYIAWIATGYVDISDYQKNPLYPWVFAYNSAVSASVAQAAQFQAALSNKADIDLSNVSQQATIDNFDAIANALAPNMLNATTIESSTLFTATGPGWISFVPVDNAYTSVNVNSEISGHIELNGKTVLTSVYRSNNDTSHPDFAWFYIGKNQTCYHDMSSGTVYFYPVTGLSDVSE